MTTFWRTLSLPALAFALATRVALFLAVWFSLRVIERRALYPAQVPDSFLSNHPAFDGWARWDSAHYVAIAQLGYGLPNPNRGEGLGFLPGYPLLMRYLIEIPGIEPSSGAFAVAGILVSNILFLVAVVMMAFLAQQSFDSRSALTATMLFAIAPFSLFYSAAYSESLFLVLCLGTLILANRGQWVGAGVVAALASGTRLAGLLLAPALIYGAWKEGERGWRLVWAGIAPTIGFALWSLFTWWRHDNPLAYFDAQSEWGGWNEHVRYYADLALREPSAFLRGDPRNTVILLNLVVAILFVAFLPRVWKQTSPSVAMFTTLIVVIHSMMTWVSLGRYLLPAVGVYLVAGSMLSNNATARFPVRETVFTVLAMALTFLAVLFAHGFWIV